MEQMPGEAEVKSTANPVGGLNCGKKNLITVHTV